jgi:hypothetical protein
VVAAPLTWRPALTAGHARAWAEVGAPKARANHPATAGWNRSARDGFEFPDNRKATPRQAPTPNFMQKTVSGDAGDPAIPR